MSRRLERVNQLLLEEIATVIRRDIDDPAVGFVTVTGVKTAPDLKNATVAVSVFGAPEARIASIAALNHAANFIRSLVMPMIRLQKMPRLVFELDETAERADRINKLLKEKDEGGMTNDE
jgi:ribosome-binding factor A